MSDWVTISVGDVHLSRQWWNARIPLVSEVVELPGKIVTTVWSVWNRPVQDHVVIFLTDGTWPDLNMANEAKVAALVELGFEIVGGKHVVGR